MLTQVPILWQALMEPYDYLASNPGKEFRSQLISAFNQWLCVPPSTLRVICRLVQMLHTASLLMDDVEDNSELRRGRPVAHKIYGVPQTINTANYVYFVVFDEIFQLGLMQPQADPAQARLRAADLAHVVANEMVRLHRGQGMDLFWRDSLICPTEEEYIDMVANKTGGLFRIAVKLMLAHSPHYVTSVPELAQTGYTSPDSPRSPVFSSRSQETAQKAPDLLPLADLIGLLFQIRDDYMNLQSSQYADNKGFAEDLSEGKFSFPIIHSIRASCGGALPRPLDGAHKSESHAQEKEEDAEATLEPTAPVLRNRHLLSVLRQRPTDEATKRYAVAYMRSTTKSFNYTRLVLRSLDHQAREETRRIQRVFDSLPSPSRVQTVQGSGGEALWKILDALQSGWVNVPDDA